MIFGCSSTWTPDFGVLFIETNPVRDRHRRGWAFESATSRGKIQPWLAQPPPRNFDPRSVGPMGMCQLPVVATQVGWSM